MGSTRRILGIIKGTKTESHAFQLQRLVHLVAKRARFGRRIQLHQLSTVPSNRKEHELLQQFKAELLKSRGNNASAKKIDVLKTKVKVLAISSLLHQEMVKKDPEHPERKPTIYQILAVTALAYGLDSKELNNQISSMSNTANKYPNQVTWGGNPTRLRKAIKIPLSTGAFALPTIEKILLESKEFAMDSKNIAAKIGISWTKENMNIINSCMQLLEVSGFVKKMPSSSAWGAHMSVWMHRAYKNPKINYPNSGMNILEKLWGGRKRVTELYTEKIKKRRRGNLVTTGSKAAEFTIGTILATLKLLEDAGIIQLQKHVSLGYPKGTIAGEAELTDYGKKLWNKYIQTRSLPEELRKILLGEKEVKPKQS